MLAPPSGLHEVRSYRRTATTLRTDVWPFTGCRLRLHSGTDDELTNPRIFLLYMLCAERARQTAD